jgi:CheY-like chemotaxis protein
MITRLIKMIVEKMMESYLTNVFFHRYSKASLALNDLKEGKSVSVVLLDVDMPVVDGWGFKRHSPSLPFQFLFT